LVVGENAASEQCNDVRTAGSEQVPRGVAVHNHDAGSTEEDLQSQVDRLALVVESLQADLLSVSRQQAATAADLSTSEPREDNYIGSRRHLLKFAGGAALVATAGSLLLDGARPAAADSNQSLIAGRANFVQDITYIRNSTGTNGTLFSGSALTSERTMFWADNRFSTLTTAIGIRGDGRESGTGIDGYGGTGVTGTGGTTGVLGAGPTGVRGTGTALGVAGVASAAGGIGLAGTGARAALSITSGTGSQPPNRTDAHTAGEIDIDANGTTWLCVADGTPGTWRKLGGTNTSGTLHAIDPVRAFDSRWAGGSRLSNALSKVVSVADGHDAAGVINAANAVPSGATAVSYVLTVTNTIGSGYLSATPGGSTSSTSSSINWFGDNQNIANGLIVAIDANRQIKIFSGGGGSTDYVVDITGYFR
jgi:hypothetical protein